MPDPEVTVEQLDAADTPRETTGHMAVEPVRVPAPRNRCCRATTAAGKPCPATGGSVTGFCPMHDPQQAEKMALARRQAGSKPRVQLGMPEGWRADFSSAPAIAKTLEALVEAGARGRIPSAMLQAAASAARAATEALTAQREADLAALMERIEEIQKQREHR